MPKAFTAINDDPTTFGDDEHMMVTLGVGKNMVRAIRFWVQSIGIAEQVGAGNYRVTDFGRAIFSCNGLDPFLEDIRTLWLIHWQLSTCVKEPLFAWDYMLNRWQYPDIVRSIALKVFHQESQRFGRPLSTVTLGQHFDTFLHTYVPTQSKKGDIQEDNLDCPLVELELIQKIGERQVDNSGKRESLYAFRREEKPEITPELFVFCIDDFWKKHRSAERTISFHDIAVAHGSPGQVFKLPELDIRNRLETIGADSNNAFVYKESSYVQQLTRGENISYSPLAAIYGRKVNNA